MARKIFFGNRKTRSACRRRPQVEALEDRTLPSTNLLGPPGQFEEKGGVSVMTYNLNEGTDFFPILGITSPAQIPGAVSQTLAEVTASDIPARARALANEIAAAQPTLIGVQEATIWSVNGVTRYDLLGDLLDDLAALNQHYATVVTAPEFGAAAPDALGELVTFQDSNAILARTDLPARQLTLTNPQEGQFKTSLTVELGGAGGPFITVPRSWTSIDASVRGETFRFVTTHLESLYQPAADAQAAELVAPGGPADSTLSVVLTGDFNSTPDTAAYQAVTGAGFQDVWTLTHPGDPGFTWGPGGTTGTLFDPTQRIDYIFVRGGFEARSMERIGTDPAVKTPSGLWPSDHTGLVATLELPNHSEGVPGEEKAASPTLGVIGASAALPTEPAAPAAPAAPAVAAFSWGWFVYLTSNQNSEFNPRAEEPATQPTDLMTEHELNRLLGWSHPDYGFDEPGNGFFNL